MKKFLNIAIGMIALIIISNALVVTAASASTQLTFSGYTWTIQKITTPTGQGNTRFWYNNTSDYVDSNGYLHMNLLNVGGTTYAAGINNTQPLGYGTYTFNIQGPAFIW